MKNVRDRIVAFLRIPARELVPHPKNPRTHGEHQRTALGDALRELGLVGVNIVRKHESGWQLIDGHLRQELVDAATPLPCVHVDLNDEETEYALSTFDAVSRQAGYDQSIVAHLRARLQTNSDAIRALVASTHSEATAAVITAAARTRAERATAGNRNQFRTFTIVLNYDVEKRLQKVLGEVKLAFGLETQPQAVAKLLDIWDAQQTVPEKGN